MPHVARLVRDALIFLLGLIFLLMLYFGFNKFFIPFLLTAMVIIGIIVTNAHEYTNPIILVVLIPLTFALGYGLQKLAITSNPALQQAISTPPIDIRVLALALIILLALFLYIYRCTLFGICKR